MQPKARQWKGMLVQFQPGTRLWFGLGGQLGALNCLLRPVAAFWLRCRLVNLTAYRWKKNACAS